MGDWDDLFRVATKPSVMGQRRKTPQPFDPFMPEFPEPAPEPAPLPGLEYVEPEAPPPVLPAPEVDDGGFLSDLGYVLDTPGALLRGVLAGTPGSRASGQRVLKNWGLIDGDENELLSGAGAAGLAADLVLDPLNLLPGFMGLKAATGTGKAAKLATQHLDDAARIGKAFQSEERIRKANALRVAEEALETGAAAVPEFIPKTMPTHPLYGDLLKDGAQIGDRAVLENLAKGVGPEAAAAQEVLKNAAQRGLGDDALRYLPDAGDRVRAGQESLLSVGGEFDPFGLFGLGGKYNPLNYTGVTKPWFETPIVPLVEGAEAAQKLQNVARGARALPGIKQGLDLFNKAPAVPGGEEIQAAKRVAQTQAGAENADALEEAQAFNNALADVKPGVVPEAGTPFPSKVGGNPIEIDGEMVDPITGEILQAPFPQELGRNPVLDIPAGDGIADDIFNPEITNPWQTVQAPDNILAPPREAPIPGTKTTALEDVGVPVLDDFTQVDKGRMVSFRPKDSIEGAGGTRNARRGIVANMDYQAGMATVDSNGDLFTIPIEKVKRLDSKAYGDYAAAKADYEHAKAYEGLTPEQAKLQKAHAADARELFRRTANVPDQIAMQGDQEINKAVKGQRQEYIDALGIKQIGDAADARALPKVLEDALAMGLEPQGLKGIDFVSAESGAVGVGDKLKIANDVFEVKEITPQGTAKLKDGIPIEVPMDRIPHDKGTEIIQAKQPENLDPFLPPGEVPALPPRTLDTMSEAIALSSPNGKMSKAAKARAEKRLGEALFDPGGMPAPQVAQPSEIERLRRQAKELNELAERGMSPRKFKKEAARLEAEAAAIEAGAGKIGKLNKAADVLADAEMKLGVDPVDMPRGIDEGAARMPQPPRIEAPAPKVDPFDVTPRQAALNDVTPPPAAVDMPLVPRIDKAEYEARNVTRMPLVPETADLSKLADKGNGPEELLLQARQAKIDKLTEKIQSTPAAKVKGADLDQRRQLMEVQAAAKERITLQKYLDDAGVKTDAAASRAIKELDADTARRITNYLEHGGTEAPEIVKAAKAVQDSYDAMHAERVAAGLESKTLASERIDYTTHVSTKEGEKFFNRMARSEPKQLDLFKALEEKRRGLGVKANPVALKPRVQQQAKNVGKRPEELVRNLPKGMRDAAARRLMKLDENARAWLAETNTIEEYLKFSDKISTLNPSMLQRLDAYRDLGVGELNEVFSKFGAKGPVFNENPAAQLFTAKARHVRTMAAKNFFDNVGERLGKEVPANLEPRDIPGLPELEQYTNGQTGIKEMNDIRVRQGLPPIGFDDPNVAKAVADTYKKMANPEQVTGALKWYDDVTGVYKSWMLKGFPAYHVRNHISNMLQSWLGDVPLQGAHREAAAKVVAGKEVSVKIGSRALNGEEIRRLLRDNGVTKGGAFDSMGKDHLDETVTNDVFNPGSWKFWERDNKILKGAERISTGIAGAPSQLANGGAGNLTRMNGQVIEDTDRAAHFIHKMQQGWTPAAAAEDVNKFLFDYSRDAKNELEQKVLSRVVFFYNYTRNIVPLMLEQVLTNTKKVKQLTQIGQQPGKPEHLPSYARDGLAVRTGTDKDGNATVAYDLNTPIEAGFSLFGGFNESIGRGGEKMLSNLNPFLKVPLEISTGRNFFFGEDIEEGKKAPHYVDKLPQGVQDLLGVNQVPTATGTRTEMNPFLLYAGQNTPFSVLSNTVSRMADSRKSGAERGLNLFTGSHIVSVDEQKELERAQKDAIKKRLKELEREGKVYSPEIFTKNKAAGQDAEVDLLMKALQKKKEPAKK